MSINLRNYFSKRFEVFTEYTVKIEKVEADQWPSGGLFLAFTIADVNNPGTKHVEKITPDENKLWLIARLYYAAGYDLDKKDVVIKNIEDPKEHARNLADRPFKAGFDLNKNGYVRLAEVARKGESLAAWVDLHMAERVDPTPEQEQQQNADLDSVFGGGAPAREPGSDDDFPL